MEYVNQPEPTLPTLPRWVNWLAILTVVGLGVGYTFRWLTPDAVPTPPLVTTNYDESQSNFNNIIFTGVAPEVPEKLPIAQAEELNRTNQEVETALFSKHKLEGLPELTGVWTSTEYTLTRTSNPIIYNLISKRVSFEDLSLSLPTGITIEQAVAAASQYVSEVFQDENLAAFEEDVTYYEVGNHPHPEETDAAHANAVNIPFGYKYGPYPVFLDKDYTYPVILTMTSENQVYKMTFRPFSLKFNEGEQYTTLSIQQAIGGIMDGRGSVLISRYDGHGTPLLDNIVSGNFTSAVLEYRVDPKTKLIIPYYRFTGQLENDEQKLFEGEVITPAIPTQTE